MILSSLKSWEQLPGQIPSHANFAGEIHSYRPKGLVTTLVTLTFICVNAAVNIAMRISPRKFSMPISKRAMDSIFFSVGAMML